MSIKVMMAMIQLMLQLFMFLTYSLELQFVEPNDETVAERTKKKKKIGRNHGSRKKCLNNKKIRSTF